MARTSHPAAPRPAFSRLVGRPRGPATALLVSALAGLLPAPPHPGGLGGPVAVAAPSAPASAPAPVAESPLANERQPYSGEPFFLLTDATYGSQEPPQVRLELQDPHGTSALGGVDIALYRIPDALGFLRQQRNLHRVRVPAPAAPEGLSNTLTHLWDSWWVRSRQAWRDLFSPQARQAVTAQAPALRTPADLTRPSAFQEPPSHRPIPGLPLVQRFRYPVHAARPIAPPEGLALEGSSSGFIGPAAGNVMVPLTAKGQGLPPGLYLVEASAGLHRATTLLFVSDTVALTKVSGQQMLVWSARRDNAQAVPGTRVLWTDGVGVLQSGQTDGRGLLRLAKAAPEQSYVFGQDPAGGVFISENFYYDSEIYNARVYAVTDRPLYRPGDEVKVKITGREFRNARDSVPLADGPLQLQALDPVGQVVAQQRTTFSGQRGADTQFHLPANAPAGGYELRLTLRDEVYAAAFRVADYQKPHFELQWLPDKPDFSTGEAVTGRLQLHYPDGRPVVGAQVSLSARAQQLSLIDGELDYAGAFPVKLSQSELTTDAKGMARFSLPPAEVASRYLLSALAADGAAYRVRGHQELLVERGGAAWALQAERQFSAPGESVRLQWTPSRRISLGGGAVEPARPVQLDWLRQEDRSRGSQPIAAAASSAAGGQSTLNLVRPGTYTLQLRDARGRLVGASHHTVTGPGVQVPAGSIAITLDQPRYLPGQTATALVTFSRPVEQALISLERDSVEAASLLTDGGDGLRTERLTPHQWRVQIPVTAAMAPNITFSVGLVQDGALVFENQGLRVEQARVQVGLRTERAVYAPGETVAVEVSTQVGGRPVAAEVSVGVVDEMIYVLQPEIAPSIEDFFFHPRRNNVRTSASLSFIGYDLATQALGQLPGQRGHPERALKVQERPRRDEVDTAAWQPRLRTDASGRTRFTFVMPDALSRWRLTGRAMTAEGLVGQQTAWVRSDKPYYLKWTSPDWQRLGDQAQASVAVFSQQAGERPAELRVSGLGPTPRRLPLLLRPGANFVHLPLEATQLQAPDLSLSLWVTPPGSGAPVEADRLQPRLRRQAPGWAAPRELVLDLSQGPVPLALPPDAHNLRLTLSADPAAGAFSRWIDELVDLPWGGVEQTASRLLPLTLALEHLTPGQEALAPWLTQRLAGGRLRLAQLASPQARFAWWGRHMAPDPFLTLYAYHADWRASQALQQPLPPAHWQRLLEVYAKAAPQLPPLQRALALDWMAQMGLPVQSLQAALLDDLQAGAARAPATPRIRPGQHSLVLADAADPEARDMAWVLATHTIRRSSIAGGNAAPPAPALAAAGRLAASPQPLAQALLALAGPGLGWNSATTARQRALALLGRVRGELAGPDRALALGWLHTALGGPPNARANLPAAGGSLLAAGRLAVPNLPAPWQPLAQTSAWGQPQYRLAPGAALPAQLAAAGSARHAFLRFDSALVPTTAPALPVQLQRRLYKVTTRPHPAEQATADEAEAPNPAGPPPTPLASTRRQVSLQPVSPGSPLDANALYLDEVQLRATGPRLRWALLQVALPPGAAVETSTWGLDLPAGKSAEPAWRPLEAATAQPVDGGYGVPLDVLPAQQTVTVRHLLRFSQRGVFQLPPARLWRVYEPEAKATENASPWGRLEVR
ncbi:MG2 domain-containing protein [Ideonella livida]|uniref:Alpha-2-macroglobulin family protein n=1 Tax=Ideonella livida TaxID=2707176 RepID=A0A7C9PH87_9BURK|nr:MG2 domain-containing protein [Ideonella livida]NDY91292.1 alpha-2-macroglobulin family protein [Ideonella livida]